MLLILGIFQYILIDSLRKRKIRFSIIHQVNLEFSNHRKQVVVLCYMTGISTGRKNLKISAWLPVIQPYNKTVSMDDEQNCVFSDKTLF